MSFKDSFKMNPAAAKKVGLFALFAGLLALMFSGGGFCALTTAGVQTPAQAPTLIVFTLLMGAFLLVLATLLLAIGDERKTPSLPAQ